MHGKLFELKESGVNACTEIIAGIPRCDVFMATVIDTMPFTHSISEVLCLV